MARRVKLAGIKNWDAVRSINGRVVLVQEGDYVEILTEEPVESIVLKVAGKVGSFQITEENFEAERSAQVSLIKDTLKDAGIKEVEINPETSEIEIKVKGEGKLLFNEDGTFQGAVVGIPINNSVVMIRVCEDGSVNVDLEK